MQIIPIYLSHSANFLSDHPTLPALSTLQSEPQSEQRLSEAVNNKR